jgi:hypothetical protein
MSTSLQIASATTRETAMAAETSATARAYQLEQLAPAVPEGLPKVYAIKPEGETRIGRSRQADVRLRDPHISLIHAAITTKGDEITVVDKESTAGSSTLGAAEHENPEAPHRGWKPVTAEATQLHSDDRLKLGDVVLLVAPAPAPAPSPQQEIAETIAGVSVLRGVLTYATVALFAVIYGYFIIEIFEGTLDQRSLEYGTLVEVAAILAGLLGSAFALQWGLPPRAIRINPGLSRQLAATRRASIAEGSGAATAAGIGTAAGAQASTGALRLRQLLSLEPASASTPSPPLVIGMAVYVIVGVASVVTYLTEKAHTPEAVKALAVVFIAYLVVLVARGFGRTV